MVDPILPFMGFNSTMVQLKYTSPILPVFFLKMFQFHNGSIKMDDVKNILSFFYLFQFHNGSIKMLVFIHHLFRIYQFQFHNGSIKINLYLKTSHHYLKSFNSTMVQLKSYFRCLYLRKVQVSIPQWFN